MDSIMNGTAAMVHSLQGWASQPFSTQMDLKGWALFTGVIIVLAGLWFMVLKDIKRAV